MEQVSCSSTDLRKYLLACESGDIEWVDEALKSGIVQVDASDDQGFTALQMAAANGHEELARLLIMRGAALEKSNQYDWTPLLHAARHGHTGVVALLLQNGAEINKKTCMGANALTYAARGGHVKTASFLIDRQIEFDMIAWPCEITAMFVASLLGHDAILRLLSDRGWDINQRMQSTFMTPLMCAAINGQMTTAQILMERGCDPNLTDINDKTALQLAQDTGKREVVGFLDRKTSNKLSMVQEEDFRMDIVEATKIGDIGRVREILVTDSSQMDYCLPQDGATPLMYAAMSGRIDIAMLLVENGCDIDRQDKISNWTALMQAIFHGKKQVAKFLINSGADVSLAAKNGITAFDMASFIDDVDTDLLRLLAAKSMNHKPSKKGDSLKRLSGGKRGSVGADVLLEGGGRKWWNKISSQLKNLSKTFQIKGNKTNESAKSKIKISKMNSTSTMHLPMWDFSDLSKGTSSTLSFMDKKKSASLFHLNSMTPHSTATMPLGLGGGGASGGETLKPVIPPFLPQPSYELTAETWGMPTQQKSQSTLDLTVNNKHPMIRPMSVRSGRDGPVSPSSENRFSFGSPSPNSSGGASSISAMYSAATSGSSATSSTLTPNNVDRFNRRPSDLDFRYSKTPSFLFNTSTHKYSSQPRLSPTGFSPSNSMNSPYKRNRLSNKSRNSNSPNLTANGRHKTSASLYDSGTSMGNSEILSSSSSSQGVILELEGEQAEDSDSSDLGSVLKNLSLEKYQSIFEKEEVDMEAFLMLDEDDLCELGITHTDSQRQILSAISHLSSNNHVQRHRNELNDNIEATIPVRNSVHSDSTDMDDWYMPHLPASSKSTT